MNETAPLPASKVAEMQPALAVEGLGYAYGPVVALDNVSFDVRPSRFTGLLGPNGAGKTTLFALITRLLRPASGWIEIAGEDLAEASSAALAPLGIVFQQPTLDLDLTVRQNLRYFASLRGMARSQADRRIERELERMDMGARAHERVRTLNGGHRRRVEIARALLHDPQLLILDEPTVGLDVPTRAAIVDHVHGLAQQDGLAVLWATHLIDEILDDDTLIVLHKGKVVDRGRTADVVSRSGARDLGAAFEKLTGEGMS